MSFGTRYRLFLPSLAPLRLGVRLRGTSSMEWGLTQRREDAKGQRGILGLTSGTAEIARTRCPLWA
jgi:hypothetical protein